MRSQFVSVSIVWLTLSLAAAAQGPTPCSLSVSPTSGPAPLTVTASGSCPDPNSNLLDTVLDWGDGSAPVISTTASIPPQTHQYPTPGTYTVSITANYGDGSSDSAAQAVNVTSNAPPHCDLSIQPDHGQAPLTVTATETCTDPENDISSVIVDWGDGTTTTASTGTNTYSHPYNSPGNFTITVTAQDSAGNTNSASKTVRVTGNNAPPSCTLTVSPATGQAPLPVHATGSCTDPENDISSESLNWGDGTVVSGTTTGDHRFANPGRYIVKVTATDSAGGQGTATQEVRVQSGSQNQPPACNPTASTSGGPAPLTVSVSTNCTDSSSPITRVVTDFGDGYYLPGGNPSHIYANPGDFTVKVKATDQAGNVSNTATVGIAVSDNPAVLVGISQGQIGQFSKGGAPIGTLNSNLGGSMTGMAFDANGTLYSTNFSADAISKFGGSSNANLMGTFGGGYNCKPESIVFDDAGNAYVGETGCSHALLKLDAYGNLAAVYQVATQVEGSDWIALAADQCTMYYTSQGSSVLAYNVCTRQQLPTFASGLATGLGLRVLPDDGLLVANKQNIVRFDSAGRNIMTYDVSGEDCWVDVALDRDGTSFWAADYCSSDIVHFDFNGNQLGKFNSGTPANTAYGVIARGGGTNPTPGGPLIASPGQANISAGQTATFNLAFSTVGDAQGRTFTFSCAALPAHATCSFSPPTASSGGITTTLTIATNTATASLPQASPRWFYALWLPMFGGIFVIAAGGRRRMKACICVVIMLIAILAVMLSCSGAKGSSSTSNPPGDSASNTPPTAVSTTPAGTYKVVVHAVSGGIESSTVIPLNVH